MTQIRTVNQVKLTQEELVKFFRTKAVEALVDAGIVTQEEATDLANVNVNWRGTFDGGIAVMLDPVWE